MPQQMAQPLDAVVIVAFQRSDGRVVGTFVHGSHGPDPAGVERSRDRLMREMQSSAERATASRSGGLALKHENLQPSLSKA